MKMDSVVMVRRGWPNEGALDRVEKIYSGATLTKGDWVAKQSDGTVALSGASASNTVGMVIQGNGDSDSAVVSGKAVVLWRNFIVDVANYDTTASYAPGSPLTVKSGKLTLANGTTDPTVGFVLDVVGSSATETAHLTALIR